MIEECKGEASFEIANIGKHYDILVIIRGCTQCPYMYEEIDANERVVCTSEAEVEETISLLKHRAKTK